MEGVKRDVRDLSLRQSGRHQIPVDAPVGRVPHLTVGGARGDDVLVEGASRHGGDHAKAQARAFPQGEVLAHGLPHAKRRTVHPVDALRAAPLIRVGGMKQMGASHGPGPPDRYRP